MPGRATRFMNGNRSFTHNHASLSVISITGPAALCGVRRAKTTRCSLPLSIVRSDASTQHRVPPSFPQGRQRFPPVAFPGEGQTWKDRKSSDFAAAASCDDVPTHRTPPVPKEANPSSSDAGPSVLINRRDHRLGIRQHLSQPISVDDLHICQVTEDFQHIPLFRRRLILESLYSTSQKPQPQSLSDSSQQRRGVS